MYEKLLAKNQTYFFNRTFKLYFTIFNVCKIIDSVVKVDFSQFITFYTWDGNNYKKWIYMIIWYGLQCRGLLIKSVLSV